MDTLTVYEKLIFRSEDERHTGIQSLLSLPWTNSKVNAVRNDRLDLFRFLFQLRVVDRLFGPPAVEIAEADSLKPKMPLHIRSATLKSSCKVCIVFPGKCKVIRLYFEAIYQQDDRLGGCSTRRIRSCGETSAGV